MTDFLEVTGKETGRRIMINMSLVMFAKEGNTGTIEFWLMKPREYEQITPKEPYQLIRQAMGVQP